jgi:hypothetical protein
VQTFPHFTLGGGQAHAPLAHWTPPGQATPQLPQFLGSVEVLTQAAPHFVSPLGQVHTPPTQFWPVAQTCPHAPQFASLVCRLTHAPLQLVWPVPQLAWHCPPAHMLPEAQALPQEPQLFGSVVRSTQAVPHMVQVVIGGRQRPSRQTRPCGQSVSVEQKSGLVRLHERAPNTAPAPRRPRIHERTATSADSCLRPLRDRDEAPSASGQYARILPAPPSPAPIPARGGMPTGDRVRGAGW